MKKRYQVFLSVIFVIVLFLSGCSRKQTRTNNSGNYYYEDSLADYDYEYAAEEYMAYAVSDDAAIYESKAAPAAYSNIESGTVQQRMVRKSASINIQVMDPASASQQIIELTEKLGGFVVSSTSSQEYYSGDIYLPRAELSVRVPSEKLTDVLEFIENLTTDSSKYVSNKRIYGVDITSDYVDTQSRLTSLEKTRDQLYEILATAENAEEALEVYQYLVDIESDIEVYKGQIKYMEESVALSSVDIKINSVKPAPTQTVKKWNPLDTVKDAFESLLDTGKDVIEGLIYFIIAVLPILVLIAVPIVLIVWLIRKHVRKNKTAKDAEKNSDKNEDVLVKIDKK